MFLFFYRGQETRCPAFEALVERHASWLGLQVDRRCIPFPRNAIACFFFLHSPEEPVGPYLQQRSNVVLASTSHEPVDERFVDSPAFDPLHAGPDTPIALRLHLDSGELAVQVPLVCPEHAYYAEGHEDLVIANDIRPLIKWAGLDFNEIAIASLFQHGTVSSPHTISNNVRRIPCGHILRSDLVNRGLTVERWIPSLSEWTDTIDSQQVEDLTLLRLDEVLRETPRHAVLFFSGGTDSSLIAARLSEMGRKDIQLVNYAFGPDDPDSMQAEEMARHLNLPFHRVVYDTGQIIPLCRRIGSDFSFPFNDLSTIPSNLMLRGAAEQLTRSRSALLGIGADDMYILGLKIHGWNRILGLPRTLRKAAVGLLLPLQPCWRDDLIHKVWGIARRTLTTQHEFGALISHNDLAGIGYPTEDALQRGIVEAFRVSIDPFSEGCGPEDRLALVYLMNGSMGWEAPKFDALRRMGVTARYPFLDGPMLRHGFSLSWKQKCADQVDKVLLKSLLTRSVPNEMVYKQKRGFSPPFRDMLAIDDVQGLFRQELFGGKRQLERFYDSGVLKKILDRGHRGAPLSRSALNLLWVTFFTTSWLNQIDEALS